MYILGINAVFHDSSACILKDGIMLAAAEEERFSHVKHGKRPIVFSSYELPFHAIDYCLGVAGICLRDVDHIAYSFDPSQLQDAGSGQANLPRKNGSEHAPLTEEVWDPLFLTYLEHAPEQLCDGYPHHVSERFHGARPTDFQWHYVDHHLAHAASAYFPSPYEEAAVLVIDGRGETVSTSYFTGH